MQLIKPSKHIKAGIVGLILAMFMGLIMVTTMMGSSSNPDCSGVSSAGDTSITDSASKNKNAKTIYDFFRSQGATPKAAAGIMGVWDFESSFNPKISNLAGSGAFGLGQWMGIPGRKANLMAFAAKKGLKADSMEAQLKFTMHELNTVLPQAKHVLKENDVHKATYDWLMDFEGMSQDSSQWFLEKGAAGQPGRYPRADHWYAKFGANDTNGDSGLPTTDADSDDESDSTVADCQTDNSAVDGTGKVPKDLPYGQNIAANKIPDDVKTFLLPNQLSDARGVSGKGWSHPGDQCVDYSVSRISALWGMPSWTGGNGGDQADRVVEQGGKKETAPHAGDIGSSQGYPPTASGEPGHTWIVEHVFADGSVLLSEQNGPESGAYIHQPKTWSIILMHPYPDGQEWHSANGGEYTPLSGKATFARPKGHMKK